MMTRQIEGIQMDGTRLRYLRTLLVGLALVAGVVRVDAYPTYEDTGQGGCQTCHPRFFDDPSSPTPLGSLHVAHLTKFGIGGAGGTMKCGQCHMNPDGGDIPVYTYTSAEGFGCAGCHGQNYGETIPMGLGLQNQGAPKASAYGLRKALDNLFAVTHPSDPAPCGSCHFPGSPATGDPSPAPAIFPEPVLPPYYGHPELNNLSDPCSSEQENWDSSTTTHLDNDGNGAANYEADSACQAFVTTTTVSPRPRRAPPRPRSQAAPPGGSPYSPASRSRTPSMRSRPAARFTSCRALTRKRTTTRTPSRSARAESG